MRFPIIIPTLIALTASFAAGAARAQTPQQTPAAHAEAARRQVTAVRVTGAAPKIDGVLDEAAWAQARPATDYIQRTPTPGAAGTLRTEARVLYDDQAIYVGVRMFDPHPDSIQAPIGRRDLSGISSEWAHVMVDSYNDRRTAFRFSVNPAGVQKDAFHSNDSNEDLGWDAVWQSAAKVDSAGWVAEYRIPLSQLRFSTKGGEQLTWGVQLSREIARRNEIDDWNAISPARSGFVSQFGQLLGLSGLKAVRRLEVLPYTVARLTREPDRPGDPFYRTNAPFGSAGGDVKYGLTSNLTLTATLNPDFGQVEADASQVNLSAFETFFPEKRPFFTEGSDIFRFPVAFPYFVRSTGFGNDQPFYSRRLGRSPQLGTPAGEFQDRPENTTILGAAKVSGKTASGWALGLLDALTAREDVRYIDTLGAERSATVEPLSNYLAARAIKDFNGGRSAIGGLITGTLRSLDESDPRQSLLTSSAITVGVDGRHRFGGGNYELSASALGSTVRGSTAAISRIQLAPGHFFQRPDATDVEFDPTRTSLSGWLADVKVEKTGGGSMRGGLYAHARSPGLEMNDVGFQRSTDWILQGAWLGYNHFNPGRWYRRWNANVNGWNGYNFAGDRLTTGFNFNGGINFKNNWYANASSDTELEALRTDVLRGGPSFTGPSYSTLNFGFGTDGRRKVSGDFYGGGNNEWSTEGHGWYAGSSINVRPSGQVRLSIGPDINAGIDPWIYVAAPRDAGGTPHYVFARIDQRSVSLTTRASYAFTPRMTVEFYAQPFVAAGSYTNFWEVTAPHAAHFQDRFTPYGDALTLSDGTYLVDRDGDGTPEYAFGRPDFNFKELRSNLVVRWEYRPGSTLFVVWGSGRNNFEADGRFRPSRDFGRLLDSGFAPSTNVLLVKVNYWLNL